MPCSSDITLEKIYKGEGSPVSLLFFILIQHYATLKEKSPPSKRQEKAKTAQ